MCYDVALGSGAGRDGKPLQERFGMLQRVPKLVDAIDQLEHWHNICPLQWLRQLLLYERLELCYDVALGSGAGRDGKPLQERFGMLQRVPKLVDAIDQLEHWHNICPLQWLRQLLLYERLESCDDVALCCWCCAFRKPQHKAPRVAQSVLHLLKRINQF